MSKQLNLFGEKAYAATKVMLYIKVPLECFVENIIEGPLETETSLHKKKKFKKAQSTWKSEGFCPWFSEVLRNVEKDFAKYASIYFVECISNCCIKILPASLTFATHSISLS